MAKGGWRRKARTKDEAAKNQRFTYDGICRITGKVIFPSRKHAKQNSKYYNDATRPYLCQYCDGIHLGHDGGYDREFHRQHNQDKYGC